MGALRVVRAAGEPYERGRTIGRALADSIRRSAAYNRAHFARRGLDGSALDRLASPLAEAARRRLPGEYDALRGMADGAAIPLLDALLPNAYEEIEPWVPAAAFDPAVGRARGHDARPDGMVNRCSALTVVTPGGTLLGHNEQWLANEPAEVVIIVEVPDDPAEPAIVSPTVASWRPAVGMNVAGHAQAVMSLTATDDRPGVPRVLVSRSALGAGDPSSALVRAAAAGRSGGYAYLHAFRGGAACLVETTATRAVLANGAGVHANHYLDGRLAPMASAASAGSLGRQARLEELTTSSPPATPEDVMAVLADHGSSPSAICLHPDPAEGDEGEAVLFSMVCDLEAGLMWVAAGRPCETPYERFEVTCLVAG